MAASSGQPQGASTAKVKKEFTPEQKRTFGLLGVAGVLCLVVAGIYLPGMLSGGSSTETIATPVATPGDPATGATTPPGAAPAPGEIPMGAVSDMPGAQPSPAAAAAPPAATAVNYAPVSRSRTDPFAPFIVNPLPPPPPPPPASIPLPPVELPSPSLQPVIIDSPDSIQAKSQPALVLPSINIPRMATEVKVPSSVQPPPRGSSSGANGGGDPQPSYDKRLSGVVIANGVRALLEITSGGELKNYVVQPGDTVEGITVLNIQRFSEGTATITRMLIRENGQERYVDLKPAPVRANGAEGGIPAGP